MKIIDLIGVPFPKVHPLFKTDKKLIKQVNVLENLIELQYDLEEAREAFDIYKRLLKIKNKDPDRLFRIYGFFGESQLFDVFLSYVIIKYCKLFVKSIGRTSLNDKLKQIFDKDKNSHDYMVYLRNKYFAHHEVSANQHTLFCLQNKDESKIVLKTRNSSRRVIISSVIDNELIEQAILRVTEYLHNDIEKKKEHIESSLTKEQLAFINSTSRQEQESLLKMQHSQHPLEIRDKRD